MSEKEDSSKVAKIQVTPNGPYLVAGAVPLRKEIMVSDQKGIPIEWKAGESYASQENYALCRCGGSVNKPYCDGTHAKIKFDGTETASHGTYSDRAELFEGPEMDLADDQELCAGLQFCHRAGGAWSLIERSDDPRAKSTVTEIATRCASGRLVALEKDGRPHEPDFRPSIGVVEDPGKGVSGPLWVKGNIPVMSAEGEQYESRNRVTLCRCGGSDNKPFCDGAHIAMRFKDGDKSL